MKPIYTYHIDFTIGDKRLSIYHWTEKLIGKPIFSFTCGEQFDNRLTKDNSISTEIDPKLIQYCREQNFDLQRFYKSIQGKNYIEAFEITHKVFKAYENKLKLSWKHPVRINIFDVTGVYN